MIHQNRRRTKTKLIERVGIFLFSGFFWGGGCGRGVEGGEILFCSEKVIPFTCCRRVNPRHFFVRLPITPSHAETHEAFLRGGQENGGAPYLSCQALSLLQELALKAQDFCISLFQL